MMLSSFLLTGCGNQPRVLTEVHPVYVYPPESLYAIYPLPELSSAEWGACLKLSSDLISVIRGYEDRMTAIRLYVKHSKYLENNSD